MPHGGARVSLAWDSLTEGQELTGMAGSFVEGQLKRRRQMTEHLSRVPNQAAEGSIEVARDAARRHR